jgi:UDP-N-acetylmuramoylalanine--D-glutamate ligase
MDRYDFFSDYAAAKHRLFMNQTSEDVAVLNADDEVTASWARGLKAHVALFSVKKELDEGLFLRGRELVSRSGGREKVLTTRDEIFLRGLHNVENVLAAFAAGLACGASPDSMRETVRAFKGVEHRIEFVAESKGVNFYNDSKATSVDATLKALEALAEEKGKVVLILGGRGKNAPYAPLAPLVESAVRALVLIGRRCRQHRIAVKRPDRNHPRRFDERGGRKRLRGGRKRGFRPARAGLRELRYVQIVRRPREGF